MENSKDDKLFKESIKEAGRALAEFERHGFAGATKISSGQVTVYSELETSISEQDTDNNVDNATGFDHPIVP
jgi:hypothetical protein